MTLRDLGHFGVWTMPPKPLSAAAWRRYFWMNAFPTRQDAVNYWRDMALEFGATVDVALEFANLMAKAHGYDNRNTYESHVSRVLS